MKGWAHCFFLPFHKGGVAYGRGNSTFADDLFRHVSCFHHVRTKEITPHAT